MQFDEVDKAMLQLLANHRELIFFFCTSPKCDLGEVEKAMFQVVANYWGLIYFLLTNPKSDLCEVEKAMFQRVAYHFESFSASWPTQSATWVRSKK